MITTAIIKISKEIQTLEQTERTDSNGLGRFPKLHSRRVAYGGTRSNTKQPLSDGQRPGTAAVLYFPMFAHRKELYICL